MKATFRRLKSADSSSARLWPINAGAFFAAVLAGGISSLSKLSLVGVFAGLIAALAVMFSRRALLVLVILSGLVVTGLAQLYVPDLEKIKYVTPVIAFILFMHGVMDLVMQPPAMRAAALRRTSSGILLFGAAFIAIATMSMAINWDPGLALLGFKGYFTIWILLYAIILTDWRPRELKILTFVFLLVAFVQLPFVGHQFLYLVPLRQPYAASGAITPVDVVAGTFGALLFGGGANAVLTLFMFIVIACLLGLWKHGRLSGFWTAFLSATFLLPVFLNETKIAVVYLPVVFLMLFYQDIIRKPLRFILMGAAALGAFAVLITALIWLHPGNDVKTFSDLVRYEIEKQTSSIADQSDSDYSKLTRWTALTFWAQENISEHPIHIALGWGPGASRIIEDEETRLTTTLAEKRYGGGSTGIRIGYTAFSALLWDVGVIGFLLVLGMFYAAYRTAARLEAAYRARDPFMAGIFDGLRAGIAIMVISLAHKDFFVLHLPFQTLMMLIFGYLIVAQRHLADEQASAPRSASATGAGGPSG
jgi:hypothetical protein